MTPRVRDAAVGVSIVGIGIAGFVSGLAGHPMGLSLAFIGLFALFPSFVRALERALEREGASRTLERLNRQASWFVALGVVMAAASLIDATTYFEHEPGRAAVDVLAGASFLLAGIRLRRWTRRRA